jgi:hypothetical protein
MREPKLITPGLIAEAIGVPIHRVLHVLASRPHIRPRARAGNLRLYDRQAITLVQHEIDRIDGWRARRKGESQR